MYHILVVGAGYVGGAIAEYYQGKEQKTFAVTRSKERAMALEKKGITPFVADLAKPESLQGIPAAHFIVISVAPDERTEDAYYETYVRGVGNFLKAMRNNPRPFLILYISSTGVWDQEGLDWVDEQSEVNPVSKRAKILRRAEEQVLASGYPAVVLRLSGIYGPGRNRLSRIRNQEWPNEGQLDQYMNLIHRDDVVNVIPAIFKSAEEGNIYIGTDDCPVPRSEFYHWVTQELNVPKNNEYFNPRSRRNGIGGKRLRNQALKDLGAELRFPTYKEGYKQLIENGE